MAQQPQYSYSPPPNEMPLYEALFAAADNQNAGYITGHPAVEFLSLSKLPVDLLKTIWTMADTNPSNNMLDKKKFIVAVRLIQLFQNGKRPMDAELRLGQGETVRPPFFEGVQFPPSGGQVLQQQEVGIPQFPQQLQQQNQQQQLPGPHSLPHSMPTPQQSPLRPAQPPIQHQQPSIPSLALTIQDPYTMTPAEQSRYAALFPSYAQDGYVYGPQAVELFSKSGMDRAYLKTIWSMCDVPVDNKLDVMEFCVAMHLIVCVTKKGLGMPEELPGSLRGFVGEGRGQPQGGMTGQQSQQSQPQVGMIQQGMVRSHMGVQQQLQPQATGPGSPGGIPSPDKMGIFSVGVQQGGGIPPPPLEHSGMYGIQQQYYSMPQQQQQQQLHAIGQGTMPNQHHQMVGHVEPSGVGGENVDDAFAGLSNAPVNDVDEYSAYGGGSTAGGGVSQVGGVNGASAHGTSATSAVHTQQLNHSPVPTQRNLMSVPNPSLAMKAQNFTPTSPKVPPSRAHHKPASPPAIQSHSHHREQISFKPGRTNLEEDEDFNSELEKLRSAHQKLQAEVISLRARANLFSDEEQETQLEIRRLAAGIAELSMELSGLKDHVAESKAKLADALVMLKAQNEKKESLEGAIKDTREINNALVSATEAVLEANEAMIKEHAYAVAATAKAAEAIASTAEHFQTDDFFSWDASPAPVPITVTQTHSRGLSDISHSYGQNWGTDDSSAQGNPPTTENRTEEGSKNVEDFQSIYSTRTTHTSNTGIQSPVITGNSGMQVAPLGGYQGVQPIGGENSSLFPMGPGPAPAQTPMSSLAPAPVTTMKVSDFGMGLMGMGAMTPMGGSLPGGNPMAFHTPAPAPPAKVTSPSLAEVESIKKEALNVEKSFRESMDLVQTLTQEVEKLETAAKKAEEELQAVEKKKGSFVAGKSKKKKEVAAAQEHVEAEREKVNLARQQLVAAQKDAESRRKLADELRQKSEQAELEAATAASLEPEATNTRSNGYDHYTGAMGSNSKSFGMEVLGDSQNQGGYNNPFAM
ncbi:hypothetical protein ACHAW6_007599 [Cyclotella cf. meneghiniana]